MMSDYEHIRCPQDIGFENIFPQEECEMRKFYGDCFHCWESSIAKRFQAIRADERAKLLKEIDERSVCFQGEETFGKKTKVLLFTEEAFHLIFG